MYPITKILKETESLTKKKSLKDWVAKVGLEESERIKKNAINRGNLLDSYVERYEKGETIDNNVVKDFLDSYTIVERELEVVSKKYGFYGRLDAILSLGDLLIITDFKNSRKPKREEYIEDYFLQVAAYIIAYNEENPEESINTGLIAVWVETPEYVDTFYFSGAFLEECKQKFLNRLDKFLDKC